MSKFNVEDFVASPTLDKFVQLRKCDLLEIANYFGIESVKPSMRKNEICQEVEAYLKEKKVLTLTEGLGATAGGDKLAIRRLELEFEREQNEKERETRFKLKAMEIDAQIRLKEIEIKSMPATGAFDVSKYVRLVPMFQEKEVDKYFLHFEKVANNLKWPKELWTTLLQSVLIGKAQEAYSSLSLEQSSNYEEVKKAILRAYQLVPEAYRQKFRNYKKLEHQTYLEFARQKENLFDRWCSSQEVKDFANLREMILLEEFKSCLHSDLRTYLDEQKVVDLHKGAVLADEFALNHKVIVDKGVVQQNQCKIDIKSRSEDRDEGPKPLASEKGKSNSVCFYCKKKGHLIANCWALAKKNKSPTALAVTRSSIFELNESDKIHARFEPFIMKGFIGTEENSELKPVRILRDTGASQSLLLSGILPLSEETSTGTNVLLQGVELGFTEVPLHTIYLSSELVSGSVVVGVRPELPIEDVSFILGNDLAGGKVLPSPRVVKSPSCVIEEEMKELEETLPEIFPSCAVTRAMSKKLRESDTREGDHTDVNFKSIFAGPEDEQNCSTKKDQGKTTFDYLDGFSDDLVISREEIIKAQELDESLRFVRKQVVSEEDSFVKSNCCYTMDSGLLMRKWRPVEIPADEDWNVVNQIVVPKPYRQEILSLAHDIPLSGHLGVKKTYDRILKYFFWPGLKKDVRNHIRICHVCQMVGKPNQGIPKAPLKPIPAFEEAFSKMLIDCVGPLPKTRSGNQFLLTLMCASTRFPEAIPLKKITTQAVIKVLIRFFTFVGLPKLIQSDQGSNFTSRIFNQVMKELGIKHYLSSPYHPESQGCLERFHQTLKTMLKSYCYEFEKDWDEGVHLLLFAIRETTQESLGFSPFELIYGHAARGPLKLLQEKILQSNETTNLLNYVSHFRYRLNRTCEIASQNLKSTQSSMKKWYDRKAKKRVFKEGDKVLVLFPLSGSSLQAKFNGPFVVMKKVNELNYIISTPDRRKKRQLCHVNMLKEYHEKTSDQNLSQRKESEVVVPPVMTVNHVVEKEKDESDIDDSFHSFKFDNSETLAKLDVKLQHLAQEEQIELMNVLQEYSHLFPDVPNRTDQIFHDVDVGDAKPIKQHPYRLSPVKRQLMQREIKYMLMNDIIEPSQSDWSSPCLLVPKPDGSVRFCTDYRKVNNVTKSDSFPIPRLDDCIDKVGKAKYITKIDLLKGYWQVPLTDKAKEISAFVTPDGFYQYKVMPFGMKNSAATFQRLVNKTISGIEGCDGYIDDIDIYSDNFGEHVKQIRELFDRLSKAKLTINLVKSEFCKAYVVFLGHLVGHGFIAPVNAKVEVILRFPVPCNKKELMRFLGMASFYRKFCKNFSCVAAPLTELLKKDQKYVWGRDQQHAFDSLKKLLTNEPVLSAPDFSRPFKLATDASDVGVGAVLIQEDDQGIEHPVSYYSRKFNNSQRNYSTIEKEILAVILALQHFNVYVDSPIEPVVVYSDHNPLVFAHKFKNNNQRLARWSLILQEYNLSIQHIRGKDNVIADALSRI